MAAWPGPAVRSAEADMLAQHTAGQMHAQATTSIGSAGGLGLPLAGVMDLHTKRKYSSAHTSADSLSPRRGPCSSIHMTSAAGEPSAHT